MIIDATRLCGTGALATLLVAMSLAAPMAQSVPRDSDGVSMELGEWRDIETDQFLTNLADLFDLDVFRAQRRWRDNRIVHQRGRFMGGSFLIQHVPIGGYNAGTTARWLQSDQKRKSVERYFEKKSERFAIVGERGVQKRGDRRGWILQARRQSDGRICTFVSILLLSREKANTNSQFVADYDLYDTVVRMADCSVAERPLDRTEKLVGRLKIVSRR